MSEQSRSLKVRSEQMNQWIEGLGRRISVMESCFRNLTQLAAGSQAFWSGSAGEAHRSAFLDYQEDMDEILSRMREELMNLQNILTNYQETEQSEEVSVQEPPPEVIL